MRFTLRSKLLAIAATIAFAFAMLIVATTVITRRVTVELWRIQESFLPKVELGPRLDHQLDALSRSFQDAVSAQDNVTLADTARRKTELLALLASGKGAIAPADAEAVRLALEDYYATAFDVSTRLIAGETGEELLDSIASMQAKQRHVSELTKEATVFDRAELAQAFVAAQRAVLSGRQTGLAVSLLCMMLVLALIVWVGRSTLAAVAGLTHGLERFGTGRFDEHISAVSSDELADVARHANQMADNLKALAQERDRQDEDLKQTNEQLVHRAAEVEQQRHTLEERNGELEATRRRLEHQTRELATVSTYKSQFLTNMSHELRTPLNSMLLLSSLLAENEEGHLSAQEVEFSKTIHSAGKDLLTLINQVLDLAKVEAGKQQLSIGPVAPRDVAERAQRVFEPLAREKGLTLKVDTAPDAPPCVSSDGRRIDQIVTNLLGNAIKFTERGTVALNVVAGPNGGVSFVVSDTGPGIAPADQERIFVPFEQIDAKAGGRHGGTGLGLTIARELALLLGGTLELVRSTPGAGTTFASHLPAQAPTPNDALAAARLAPLSAAKVARPLLLLMEDDVRSAQSFCEVIEAQGLDCVRVPDSAHGLKLAHELDLRGIVVDVKLHDGSGLALSEQLRRDPKTASIPVQFVSALPNVDAVRPAGAVGRLDKPATRAELKGLMQTLARARSSAAACPVLVVDGARSGDGSLMGLLDGEPLAVRKAATLAQALETLAREPIGWVLLDLSQPELDGLELLDVMARRGAASLPSVVVYTDRALSEAERTRLDAYSDAVALKEGTGAERLLDEVRSFARSLSGTAPRPPAVGLRFDGKKVLVADDDVRTTYALSAMLQAKGAHVIVAATGTAALAALEAHRDVDAVLMDVMMPEMDGFEAMRRVRQHERLKALPIIALTANAMKGDDARCFAAGATAYLPKPIGAENLLPLLHALIAVPS